MTPVSRETPTAPAAASGVFSVRPEMAVRYAGWLVGAGVERGLIGPREAPRIWERHLLNCAAVEELIPAGATVADIGSGAGLPGIPLALARPDLQITLIEPLLRRTMFLEEVVEDLGLGSQVRIRRGRAEDFHGELRFDRVTSRAVAPLAKLARWSVPLVAPGGSVLALKGDSARNEIEASRVVLSKLGVGEALLQAVARDRLGEATTVVELRVAASG